MAEDDIYKSKARYEKLKAKLPEPTKPPKVGKYYVKNRYFSTLK